MQFSESHIEKLKYAQQHRQKQPNQKLTPEQIREIKKLLLNKNIKIIDIARMFNTSPATVSQIKNNKRFADIN